MPNPRRDAPPPLALLANHAFVIIFLRTVRRLLDELFTEEVEYHPFGQSPFLMRMSGLLWPLCRKSRKHKRTPRNTDRIITDIVEFIDECNQRAEMGYFFRTEFISEICIMTFRLRTMLDLEASAYRRNY